MRWEELTGDRFAEAVKECEGVCLIALSVIERHGHHLPLGTDMYIGREILNRAAAIEPAIEMMPLTPSLALRLARVAMGAVDGAFAGPNSHDWDLAAADLLVHEAGGIITTLTGRPLIYNQPNPVHDALLAAGRARHAALLGLIRNRIAEFA